MSQQGALMVQRAHDDTAIFIENQLGISSKEVYDSYPPTDTSRDVPLTILIGQSHDPEVNAL